MTSPPDEGHSCRKLLADLDDPSWWLQAPADPFARHDNFHLEMYDKAEPIDDGRVGTVWRYVWPPGTPRSPGHPAQVAVKKVGFNYVVVSRKRYQSNNRLLITDTICYLRNPPTCYPFICLQTQVIHPKGSPAGGQLIRQREIDLIKKLSHPNIVKLIKADSRRDTDHFVMPLYPMNLRKYVEGTFNVGDIDMDLVRCLCRQLVEAVQYLHEGERPIIHGDLKPDNIMVEDLRLPKEPQTLR